MNLIECTVRAAFYQAQVVYYSLVERYYGMRIGLIDWQLSLSK